MHRPYAVVTLLALGASALAQSTVIIPAPAAAAAGDSSNAFPWGTSALGWAGLRLMAVYGAVNFTSQNINFPVIITGLKWRPDDGAPVLTGGTFATSTILMSTSSTGWGGVTTNYATNHGPDLTTVYQGAVTHTPTPGAASWTQQSWCVDVQLATPFLYDPAAGDLVIDVDYPASSFSGGAVGQMDVQSANSNSSRVYASTLYPATNGTQLNHGPVVEVTYQPTNGYASNLRFGTGCKAVVGTSFYEAFVPYTFDLANSSMSLLNTGSGYIAVGGIASLYPTTGATSLAFAANGQITRTLTSGAIMYGIAGQTTALTICANGFVAVGTVGNGTGSTPVAATMLNAPYTGWWSWHGYDPSAPGSGQVKWEETSSAVYVTWDGVYSSGTTGPGSTFQLQLEKGSGNAHYVWGAMATTGSGHVVGFSEGGPSADPGSMDISAALPSTFQTAFEVLPLMFDASARPVLGSSFDLLPTRVPPRSMLGAVLFGLTEYHAGLSLAGIGMPGCYQYVSPDAQLVFVPAGTTAVVPMTLPISPVFAGVQIDAQAAVHSPGANLLNAVTSNGLRMTLDVQ
ncbi:MAG: hypothetical protein U1E73_12515 [Planctomycetota bacterium]